jgi:aryl-alcohol dehydrogenase-like predicted oxidoreductase
MSLGTWGLSGDAYGKVEAADARKVIERAVEIGFTLFDTSDAYGAGAMEKLLGEVLAPYPHVTIVTKIGTDRTTDPARKRFDADYLRAAAERSTKRLGRDRLDVCLLHNPSASAVTVGESADVLKELKKDGLVRHWGVAAGDSDVARAAARRGAEVIEIMVSRAGVLARSVLAHGLLGGGWDRTREFVEGDHRAQRWTRLELARRVGQLDAIHFLLHGEVRTLRSAALRFVLANSLVSSAVLGPRTVEQLDELVSETGMGPLYLPDEDMAQLPRELLRVGIDT